MSNYLGDLTLGNLNIGSATISRNGDDEMDLTSLDVDKILIAGDSSTSAGDAVLRLEMDTNPWSLAHISGSGGSTVTGLRPEVSDTDFLLRNVSNSETFITFSPRDTLTNSVMTFENGKLNIGTNAKFNIGGSLNTSGPVPTPTNFTRSFSRTHVIDWGPVVMVSWYISGSDTASVTSYTAQWDFSNDYTVLSTGLSGSAIYYSNTTNRITSKYTVSSSIVSCFMELDNVSGGGDGFEMQGIFFFRV